MSNSGGSISFEHPHHNRPDRFDDDAWKAFQLNFSDTEVNFLVYLGWKTFGWALVLVGVLLVLRFLKVLNLKYFKL